MLSLVTRQLASAFNQPLSFDISSVTNMPSMFHVRSPRALPSALIVVGPPCTLLALPPLPYALSPPCPHVAPPSMCRPVLLRQGTGGLSDANKLLIRCAWSGSALFVSRYGSEWSSLGACSPSPPSPPLPPSPPTPPLPPPTPPLPPTSPPGTFNSKSSLQDALAEWCGNPASAEAAYGHISAWDTGAVTDMSSLVYDAPCRSSFNEAIGSWDVAQVTNMYSMFGVRSGRSPIAPPHTSLPPHLQPAASARMRA